VSWIGAETLFRKEMRRFMRVPGQTLLGPALTAVLYLFVFGVAVVGSTQLRQVAGVPYIDFIVPGLVMLGIVSNAFLNPSSSLIGAKIAGTIVDLLVTPLGALEITFAMVGAAAVRGLMVGFVTWIPALLLRGLPPLPHPGYALAFPLLAAIAFGAVGMLTGLWAERFEQLNVVPAFVLTQLTFFAGVFYDVRALPEPWSTLSHLNPILYLVEGMRHGLLGVSAVDPDLGLLALVTADVILCGLCATAVRVGWKLRA
jgi:ABC-2 type transport system permease protein